MYIDLYSIRILDYNYNYVHVVQYRASGMLKPARGNTGRCLSLASVKIWLDYCYLVCVSICGLHRRLATVLQHPDHGLLHRVEQPE